MEEAIEAMLEMEAKLRKDAGGNYRKEVRDQLSGYSVQLKRTLDSGLPPDEFQAVSKLKDAVEAASDVVGKVWQSFHG
jgi:hypothetical protein